MYFILLFFICRLFTYSLEITEEERKWMDKNKNSTFEIYLSEMEGIFSYKDKETGKNLGVYEKLIKDFENEIKGEYNIKFNLVTKPRNILKNKEEENKAKIALNLVRSTKRENEYEFIQLPTYDNIMLITKDKKNASSLKQLKKMKVAIVENTTENNFFNDLYPDWKNYKVNVKSVKEAFEALEKNEVQGVITKSEYTRNSMYEIKNLEDFPKVYHRIAVKKEFPELGSMIERFFSAYDPQKVNSIIREQSIGYYKNLLRDDKDYAYIKKRYKNLKIYIPDSKGLVLFYYKRKNKMEGYLIQNIDIIKKILDIPIEIVTENDGKHEIFGLMDTSEINLLEDEYQFINPYYKVIPAVAGRANSEFIFSLEGLEGYKVGTILKKNSLSNKVYASYREAFSALEKKEIDYLLGDYRALSIAIENEYMFNKIMIMGSFSYKDIELGYGIKKEHKELINVFKKITLNHLIENKFITNEINKNNFRYTNYQIIGSIFTGSILTISLLIYMIYLIMEENKKSKRILNNLVESFETANKLNDQDTGMHIVRLNHYSKFLAEEMKCSKFFISEISKYASLHDIGKIGIRDSILKKEGKLTDEEFNEMKKHSLIGLELVKKMKIGKIAENIVLHHHEKWNGKGYPLGFKGEDIPLEARIVALADVYDALRQKRVYKEAFTHEEAMDIISKESNVSFDPFIVEIFRKNNQKFDDIFIRNSENMI